MELGVGFTGDPPVAHIAVVRPVNLADGLLFNSDSLHSLNGDNCGHTDASAGLDLLAKRGAIDVLVDDVGNMLLVNALDGKAELIDNRFRSIPCIGGLKLCRMSDLCFKLFRGQVAAMCFSKCNTIFFYIVT